MFNKKQRVKSAWELEDEKLKRRINILYDHPSNKPDRDELKKKKKNRPPLLGEIGFDDDEEENITDKYSKESDNKKNNPIDLTSDDDDKKEPKRKSREERTPEEEEEILDLMYPTMRNDKKKKEEISEDMKTPKNKEIDGAYEIKKSNDKQGQITGAAAEMQKPEDEKFDNTEFSDSALKKARAFIHNAESFDAKAYRDEKGIWTIGYGHTKGVKEGDVVTQEEAEKLYAEDFKVHSRALRLVKVPLNDNEKVALASLVYNIGETQFSKSTVLKKLNEGDKKAAAEAFELFCKESQTKIVNGKPVKKLVFSKGLYKRRLKEKQLFLTPVESDE